MSFNLIDWNRLTRVGTDAPHQRACPGDSRRVGDNTLDVATAPIVKVEARL
ncbi:hypothetical protein [Myxococcus fulvus]|uniref:hypothetical protein n=1 Tax=Myxococcus TaxID=32 RepID=UPI0020C0A3FE|nr:hypothetical protein [Myxococcus fulvus]MCK8503964.1 hypothetical protein [Myxococcus fulvus]